MSASRGTSPNLTAIVRHDKYTSITNAAISVSDNVDLCTDLRSNEKPIVEI